MEFIKTYFDRFSRAKNDVPKSIVCKDTSPSSVVDSSVSPSQDEQAVVVDAQSKAENSITETVVAKLNERSVSQPEFFGRGKMNRPNWVPKSMKGIKKVRYWGVNDLGYHLFKVWYVNLLEFEWEYRDYEELAESYPHLIRICVHEIRNGFLSERVPVRIVGAIDESREPSLNLEERDLRTFDAQKIGFQAKSKLCAKLSFVNVMGMKRNVFHYIQQAIPGDFISLCDFHNFLKPEGIQLKEVKPGYGRVVNKTSWLVNSAEPGKYLVSGNGHVVGIHVVDKERATIYDCAENQTKPLTEANIEFSLGKRIDEIRFVYDRRTKKAKTENILNNVIM